MMEYVQGHWNVIECGGFHDTLVCLKQRVGKGNGFKDSWRLEREELFPTMLERFGFYLIGKEVTELF